MHGLWHLATFLMLQSKPEWPVSCLSVHFETKQTNRCGDSTHAQCLQVVVAVDDSCSMAENGCGSFALEAVTLICRAMARLEVGEMGVVSYGGSNSMTPLHPLEKPFTDADGAGIMAQMKFAQVQNCC